jgi:hypothetical protein
MGRMADGAGMASALVMMGMDRDRRSCLQAAEANQEKRDENSAHKPGAAAGQVTVWILDTPHHEHIIVDARGR